MSSENQEIHVVVAYIGHEAWKHPFRPTDNIHSVKVAAMTKGFEIEEAAADKYALQLNGADLPETTTLDKIGKNPLAVDLVLRQEPNKGT